MKLLCDEMLMRLGRWLRAAGYDTAIAENGESDRNMLARSLREGRLLLTCDKKLIEHKGASQCVVLLSGQTLHERVQEVRERLAIDWLHAPFSRCLLCNAELESGAGPYGGLLPDYVERELIPVSHCPRCAKPFWQGGHVERMRRKLAAWREGE